MRIISSAASESVPPPPLILSLPKPSPSLPFLCLMGVFIDSLYTRMMRTMF